MKKESYRSHEVSRGGSAVHPSISVIMATLNSGKTLDRCLGSVRRQDYPQAKIEIILADGGSTDKTRKIAKKYRAKVVPENTRSPEGAKAHALTAAKNDLVLEIDDDNVLPGRNWLKKMVGYFDKEKGVTGVYPWRYAHLRRDKALNRYFSLYGVNDPVAYFLGRADRQSYHASDYTLAGKAVDRGDYFLVEFTPENLPTVGANGFLIKRKTLLKAQVDEKHFYHIDVNMDLVRLGLNKYIVVKNDIRHISGERFWHYFKKRKKYMENLYLRDLEYRRYYLYDKKRDRQKIMRYSLYALTLVGPVLEAMRGYTKKRDAAWFLHPVVCFLIFWIYFTSVVNWQGWWHYGQITRKLAGKQNFSIKNKVSSSKEPR